MNEETSKERVDRMGDLASGQQKMEDVPGPVTWPNVSGELRAEDTAPPPVGLNWAVIAGRFGIDRLVLEHSGHIVFPGEYFPSAGYYIHPGTLEVRPVDVGDFALQPGYFLGQVVTANYKVKLPLTDRAPSNPHYVVPARRYGPVIGLFADVEQARRVRQRILQNSLGSGVTLEMGPLGAEVHVARAELGGRVATVIAGHSGAVISIGGRPVADLVGRGQTVSGQEVVGDQAYVMRPGTGTMGQSSMPAEEWGGSQGTREL